MEGCECGTEGCETLSLVLSLGLAYRSMRHYSHRCQQGQPDAAAAGSTYCQHPAADDGTPPAAILSSAQRCGGVWHKPCRGGSCSQCHRQEPRQDDGEARWTATERVKAPSRVVPVPGGWRERVAVPLPWLGGPHGHCIVQQARICTAAAVQGWLSLV